MGVYDGKQVRGLLIRFTILILLIISLVFSGFSHGERTAFLGPVVITLLTLFVIGLYAYYNRMMNPGPDDPMYLLRQDYIPAVGWCIAFLCYLEVLSLIQYLVLPRIFPSLQISPIVFQGLVLVPLAVSLTAYVLWEILCAVIAIRNELVAWSNRDPKGVRNTAGIFSAFMLFVGIIFLGMRENSSAFSEGRIDLATYNLQFSYILWIIIILSLIVLVYLFVSLINADNR